MADQERLLTAAECARRIGLSVRTLRVYEARGLLRPARTEKNWRLYGAREIARLGEILTLKSMGLSLGQIALLLSEPQADLGVVLDIQYQQLIRQKQDTESTLALVTALRAKAAGGEIPSVNDLIDLAKETNAMTTNAEAVAWRRYEQMRPRTEVAVSADQVRAFAGYYRFAHDAHCEIAVDGDRLTLQMLGQPRVALFAEAPNRFFMKAVAAQVTFERDGDAVAKMTLHQGGLELDAQPTDAAGFAQAKAALEQRVARRQALPGSEALLRRLIAEHRTGTPDYALMSEPLGQIVREQMPIVVSELERLGHVETIAFRGVDGEGFDVYDVTFQRGNAEFGLSLGVDQLVTGLYMRPAV